MPLFIELLTSILLVIFLIRIGFVLGKLVYQPTYDIKGAGFDIPLCILTFFVCIFLLVTAKHFFLERKIADNVVVRVEQSTK